MNDDKIKGVPLICKSKACNHYAWVYRGKRTEGMYVGCPRCKNNVRIVMPKVVEDVKNGQN